MRTDLPTFQEIISVGPRGTEIIIIVIVSVGEVTGTVMDPGETIGTIIGTSEVTKVTAIGTGQTRGFEIMNIMTEIRVVI